MKLSAPPSFLRVSLLKLQVVWRQWDVHTMVLASFAFQLVLFLVVPFRKQTSNGAIIASVWLAYLLADWVAAQAIGLISKPYGPTVTPDDQAAAELYAFWAQFLLLHLGGPDTITALSLEDNELWLRTGLHLAVQVYGSFGVLVRSVARSQSGLWAPTIFMFVAGIIKYLERLSSLFHGRLLKHSDDVKVSKKSLAKYVDKDVFHDVLHNRDVTTRRVKRELTSVEMVSHAFYFFHRFKALYAGQEQMGEVGNEINVERYTREYWFARTPGDAWRVLENQLNMAYEVFYTKTIVICAKSSWKMIRHVVTSLQVVSLVMWLFFTDKKGFRGYNIRITYTLLVGAIVVDVFAFLRIRLWSNWTIARPYDDSRVIGTWFHNRLLSSRKRSWGKYWRKEDAPAWACFKRAIFRQWSESIPQVNLMAMCIDEPWSDHMEKVIEFSGVREILERRKYVSRRWFSDHLRDFIFQDLVQKRKTKGGKKDIGNIVKGTWACTSLCQRQGITLPSLMALLDAPARGYDINSGEQQQFTNESVVVSAGEYDDTEQQFTDKSSAISGEYDDNDDDDDGGDADSRQHFVEGDTAISGEYDAVVMRWHIITELCLDGVVDNDDDTKGKINSQEDTYTEELKYPEICKTLSEYMMYLLIHQQDMMPINTVYAGPRLDLLKFHLRFFANEMRRNGETRRQIISRQIGHKAEIYHLSLEPILNELTELEEKKIGKWKFIAKVWGEILYYAAIRCKPSLHAAKLKQGGELVSFVWLLMAQLGFGPFGRPEYDFEPSQLLDNEEDIEPTNATMVDELISDAET